MKSQVGVSGVDRGLGEIGDSCLNGDPLHPSVGIRFGQFFEMSGLNRVRIRIPDIKDVVGVSNRCEPGGLCSCVSHKQESSDLAVSFLVVTDLVDTLAWLVDIPSETGSEIEIRNAIGHRLSRFPQELLGRSVVVGEPGPDKVLLVGHTDTVPLQGHVGARIEADRLYGLGATDMKGGLAVMIHLIEDLGDESLAGVFYAGEEGPISGNDLGAILKEEPWLTEAGAAVVMEPTNRELQFGCQGAINARVGFSGEAAHSARPWLGENAITKASGFLEHMGGLEPESHIVGGLEFKEVMSITKAEGGVAHNIIPSEFSMNVNYRFAPDRSIDDAIAHLEEVCERVDNFEVSDTAPAGQVDIENPLFARLTEVTGAASTAKQGWTDVAQLSAVGVPAVNFGPGETVLAHKPGESVLIDDLRWFYESLSAVLR